MVRVFTFKCCAASSAVSHSVGCCPCILGGWDSAALFAMNVGSSICSVWMIFLLSRTPTETPLKVVIDGKSGWPDWMEAARTSTCWTVDEQKANIVEYPHGRSPHTSACDRGGNS